MKKINDSLYAEVEDILEGFAGKDAKNIMKGFDNSKEYPEEFLKESIYFVSAITGREQSLKIFHFLIKKHKVKKIF